MHHKLQPPKDFKEFPFHDIMLTHLSSDLPTRWHAAGSGGTWTEESGTVPLAALAAEMGWRGSARKEAAVSHRMFLLGRPWETSHPCLLPPKPGSAGSLALLLEALLSPSSSQRVHAQCPVTLGKFLATQSSSLEDITTVEHGRLQFQSYRCPLPVVPLWN